MNRRQFLGLGATGVAMLVSGSCATSSREALVWPDRPSASRKGEHSVRELSADVVIVVGGVGGCAAALAATRMGARVILTEETDWLGGQLTQQAVPPDENPWIESHGGTRSYLQYRALVRDYYRNHYPLTKELRDQQAFNPGGGGVSRLCHEPRISVAVLEAMLAPAVSFDQLLILREHYPVDAEVSGDRVESVIVQNRFGDRIRLQAPYFLDATEQGDLLPLTRTEYVTGFESQKETGESHAPSEAQPQNIQAVTWCFPVEYLDGEDHTIDRPEQYGFWRDYVPQLNPPWSGKLLDLAMSHPHTLAYRPMGFNPLGDTPEGHYNLFLYRKIAQRSHFAGPTYRGDITLVNWPQNDYLLGNFHDVSEKELARHIKGARQLSLSLLYWLQTQAPRPDGGAGWKGLRLRPDLVGTEDGLAKRPYIRESRRIRAEFTVVAQHIAQEAREEIAKKTGAEPSAERFEDSVGIGYYRLDLHPSTGGDNYIDMPAMPFQIPLGALVPRRMENLLPACKNLGVTHLTNGCYRLHPVEWNIGESAGALAAFCLREKEPPRQIRRDKGRLADFQKVLSKTLGVRLQWSQT
ncbi:MAG TPA: FAD-dependent oxidoreductase [Sedimentisphaerales bacterium]|nr:FAD-dependent oxidoreductase [Sedimentisphaerales bacterium]